MDQGHQAPYKQAHSDQCNQNHMQGIEAPHVVLVIRVLAYAQKSPSNSTHRLQHAAAPLKQGLGRLTAADRVVCHAHELPSALITGTVAVGNTGGRAAVGAGGVREPTSKKV